MVFNFLVWLNIQLVPILIRVRKISGGVDEVNFWVMVSQNTGILSRNTVMRIITNSASILYKPKLDITELSNSNVRALDLNIVGLHKELLDIDRWVITVRYLPLKLSKEINIALIRGCIIHGPPGTGKTMTARQLSSLLGCRNPTIANGPETFSKLLGEFEGNIRKIFRQAKSEWNIYSELHVICKT